MTEKYLSKFSNEPLDTNLRSTPFMVQTNWHVIMSAPSFGKSTLINLMKEKGFKTTPGFARIYIEREMVKGLTVHEVQKDLVAHQRGIVDFHIKM